MCLLLSKANGDMDFLIVRNSSLFPFCAAAESKRKQASGNNRQSTIFFSFFVVTSGFINWYVLIIA